MYNRNIQAVLFDLDGTLVNTIGDIAFALNTALIQAGVPVVDDDTCMSFVGRGLRNALKNALDEAGHTCSQEELSNLLEILMATYRAHPADRSFVYPGIEALLKNLVAHGLAIGVLSNKEESLVLAIVAKLFPGIPFVSVHGMVQGLPGKPDPSQALAFASVVGLDPSQVLVVGDSEVDALLATNAHCPVVLVTWGFRPKQTLLQEGYGPLCDTVGELESEVGTCN